MVILTDQQIQRYSRQIILKEMGATGMEHLLKSRVLIVGAGGLGCSAAQMLVTAGIGHIRLVDADTVDISNLPRQVLHTTNDVGKLKVESIKEKIEALNPDVKIELIPEFATRDNMPSLLKGVDYVIEASDNFLTKFLVNDACVYHQIPFSIAGVVQFMGQVFSVRPGQSACYRCVFHGPSKEDSNLSCSGAGVMNTVPNFAGLLQANEALKQLAGLTPSFLNRLFVFDLNLGTFDYIAVHKSKACIACQDLDHPLYLNLDYTRESQSFRL